MCILLYCVCVCVCTHVLSCLVMSGSLQPYRLQPTRVLCPWNFSGKNTGVGYRFLFQGIFLTQGLNPLFWCLLYWQADRSFTTGKTTMYIYMLLSRFSCVRLCTTPQTAAHQAPPSLGFSRQEHWSGLPFCPPMHESKKSK